MNWQVVCLKDVTPTPWRNGGGTTRELLTWPDSTAWRWRASVAEVAQPGPFSSFAGVRRWFAVLEGDGVCLTVDGQAQVLTASSTPFEFEGAASTACTLLGGKTQDFNLMVRSGTAARMERVNGNFQMTINTPKIIAVYAHDETATVQIGNNSHVLLPHSLGWVHAGAQVAFRVQAADALLMEIDA